MNNQAIDNELTKIINEEINSVESIGRTLKENEGKLLSDRFKQFETDLELYSSDLRKPMSRRKMKCVTIGNTSNGKSSILNVLLNTNVLPTGRGRTTTRFISVEGCDDDKGFLMNDGQELDMNEIGRFLYENRSEIQGIETIVKIFVPKSQCDLLHENSEIWDCPGINQSDEIDSLIKDHCQDADVILMVINGGSTMEISEKSFFRGLIKEGIRPCIYFIVNKWDKIESGRLNAICRQHKESIKECFVDEMKFYSNEEIKDRIFFLSATKISLEDEDGNNLERLRKRLKNELGKIQVQKIEKIIEHILNERSKLFDWFKQPLRMKTTESADLLGKYCEEAISEIKVKNEDQKQFASSRYCVLKPCYVISNVALKLFYVTKNAILRFYHWCKDKLLQMCSQAPNKDIEKRHGKVIGDLKERLLEIFIENSCIEVSPNQVKQYLDFDDIRIERSDNILDELSKNIKICVEKFIKDQEDSVKLMRKLEEQIMKTEDEFTKSKEWIEKIEKGDRRHERK